MKDVKKSPVKPTNNYVKQNDKVNPVAPARKGFQPKTSTQMEDKNKFAGYSGYASGKTGSPKHCSIASEFGTEPKKLGGAGKTSDGKSAPKSKGSKY